MEKRLGALEVATFIEWRRGKKDLTRGLDFSSLHIYFLFTFPLTLDWILDG